MIEVHPNCHEQQKRICNSQSVNPISGGHGLIIYRLEAARRDPTESPKRVRSTRLSVKLFKFIALAALCLTLNGQVVVVRHRLSCPGSPLVVTAVGTTTWTVPSGCSTATFEVYGPGGTFAGGGGGYGKATFVVSPGQGYTVVVASAGGVSSVKLSGTNKVSVPSGLSNSGSGSSATIGVGGTSTVTHTGGNAGVSTGPEGAGGGGGAGPGGNGGNGAGGSGGGGGPGGAGGAGGGGAGGDGGPGDGVGSCNPGLPGSTPGGGGGSGGDDGMGGCSSGAGGNGKVIITFS